MYLRHTTVRKNGKVHTYWRLVRSVRVGRKVRQETVAHLGELDAEGRARASALADHFLGDKAEEPSLFGDSRPIGTAKVRVDEVRAERGRAFGDVWLAWALWRALHLDDLCGALLPEGREAVPWSKIACILALARFCEPSSELHIAEDWYRKTCLEDLLGVKPERINHTRLYEGLDRLLVHKKRLEEHLKERAGTLFELSYDLLLYDVTSTYFEGEALGNALAKRGYSRDKRPDCKQVCIGLVVTRGGFPVGYEVFAGNRTDVTTVQEIVLAMEARYGRADRIWVMDRGMVNEENLCWLRAEKRLYVVGTPRSDLRKWECELTERRGWDKIREDLEVKLCAGPDGKEVFILCRSADRQEKEKAMHERFSARIVEGLESLGRRLTQSQKPEDRGKVERQIGRLLQRNSRAAARFEIEVHVDPKQKSGLRLDWKENTRWSEWASLTEGTYLLRSNVTDWTSEELWRTYIQLCDAEEAFRIHKTDLKLRPIWHQRKDRVLAHILVCFLAYVMWKTIEGWMARAGIGRSPRTILEELKRIQSVDVILPLENGPELRLRCVVRPDRAQAQLLDRLGLVLPKRLRPPNQTAKM